MFKKLIKKIASRLNSRKIPYMMVGGQAVLLYGEPRFTKDIDITLGIDTSELNKLTPILSILKLKVLVDNVEDFVNRTMVLPSMDTNTGIRIDFIFSNSSYERMAIKRTVSVKFDRIAVKVASLEDVIIHKIIAGRARDIEDIETIITKNLDFDRGYILHWLKKFDHSLQQSFSQTFKDIEKKLSR